MVIGGAERRVAARELKADVHNVEALFLNRAARVPREVA